MEKWRKNDEELIIIGDLSKMYNISKRTLRLYHEMDLLTPYHVDARSGYRYYIRSQFPRLDLILQMKSVGLSLKHIKQMLSTRNLSLFEALLGEQMDTLDRKITEYKICRDSLAKQLEGCRHMRNPPTLDSIFIEYIPRRTVFFFDIDNYDLEIEYPEGSPWKSALEKVKTALVEKEIPLTLFQQVGGVVKKEFLLHDRLICSGAFIHANDDHQFGLEHSYIDSGPYACMYQRYIAMDNLTESAGVRRLLRYIEENEYQIAGSYLAEVVAETSIFDYHDSNIYLKQQIPIKVVDEGAPG